MFVYLFAIKLYIHISRLQRKKRFWKNNLRPINDNQN